MDQDVSNLMMSMLSDGGRDKFGIEGGQRTVLTLDRIMGSSPRSIGSRFLELPVEILADIVELLAEDASSLAKFGLSEYRLQTDGSLCAVCRDLFRL